MKVTSLLPPHFADTALEAQLYGTALANGYHDVTGANPKAFAFSNPGKLNKQAARSHDVRICYLSVCAI